MKVIFARSNKPIALLIRLVTWSRWHHCAHVSPDGKSVIEAKGGVGVIETPIDNFMSRYRTVQMSEIPSIDDDKAWEFSKSQLGKDYDLRAVFGILFRTSWDDTSAWFCSELVAAASGIFRHDRINRVSPEHLWMISNDIRR